VIPAAFAYHRAATVAEAVALLADHGDTAAILAGGHSLLPMMKLRQASPSVLVDIGPCRPALSFVRVDGDELVIGALTTHHDVVSSPEVSAGVPILAAAAGRIGDPQVRQRGTIGGSLAHGDPAGDLPGVALALGATIVVAGASGERRIAAADFFTGSCRTARAPGEVLTEVRLPRVAVARWSYQRFTRQSHGWPVVAVAVVRHPDEVAVALVHMDRTPIRATAVETALAEGAETGDAAERAADGCDPSDDLEGSSDYRRHLARVLTRRALEAAGL